MFALLLRHRLRLWWYGMTRGTGSGSRSVGLVALTVLALGGGALVAANTAYTASRLQEQNPAALPGLLSVLFFAGMTFTLFLGVSSIIHQLYLASDIDLLLAAPVHLPTLFRLKLVETMLGGWVPGFGVLAGMIGYGLATHAGAIFFILALPVTVLVLALMAAVSMTAIMLLARIVPPGRVQGVLALFSAVLIAGVWLAFQTGAAGQTRGQFGVAAERWSHRGDWLPSGWAGNTLYAAQTHAWGETLLWLGLLGAGMLLSVWLASAIFSFTFTVSRGHMTEAVPTKGSRAALAGQRGGPRLSVLPAPIRAVAIKDLRLLRRDPRMLSGFIFPAVMGGFWGFRMAGGVAAAGDADAGFWAGLLAVPMLLLLGVGQIGLSSMNWEGRGYAILHLAPIRARTVLLGKMVAVAAPTMVLVTLAVAGLGLWHHAGPLRLIAGLAMATWLAVGDAAACVAVGALDPNFEADNPRKSAGCMAGLLFYLISGFFLATSTGLFGWLVLLGIGEVSVSNGIAMTVSVVLAVCVAVAIAIIVAVAAMAAGRLERWEEA